MQTINVLIIDDHPIVIESYRRVLNIINFNNSDFKLQIDSAEGINSAVTKINRTNKKNNYDLILLDISLPASKEFKIFSGEQLGVFIKKKIPEVKIIVITSYNDNLRILNIFSSLIPDGFLIKSDMSSESLSRAIKDVIAGNPHYSKTVNNLFRKKIITRVNLDKIDINILYELSNGSKMKELLEIIPLTKSGIEKRKRLLKDALNAKGGTDRDLVLAAKEKGFI